MSCVLQYIVTSGVSLLLPPLELGVFCNDLVPQCISTSADIPYCGLFSWVEIFVKSWKRLPELNFVVLIFVARSQFDCLAPVM